MNEAVSVVIPAYNAERYLQESVESVARQSVPPSEIIIVDDGSTDRTLEVAYSLASKYPNVEVLRRSNGGAAAARNDGTAKAHGNYILFLDSDDRLHENAILHHLNAFKEHPKAIMVFGSNDMIDESGSLINPNPTPVENVTLEDLALRVIPIPSQSMYRKSAIVKVGGYDERFRQSQDVDLNLRLARVGEIFSHGMKVADYRRHSAQVTSHRARTCRAHVSVLERNFGKESNYPNSKLLKKSKNIIYSRFGYMQYRAALGALRRGRFSEAFVATRLAILRLNARLHGENWRPKR